MSSAAKVVRLTTGLTGLKVSPNPKRTLGILYAKTSRALNKLPADCAYRKYTESIISQRSAIIKEAASVEEMEKKINCGLIEEVIVQAENELQLARNFYKWKPWEKLVEEPKPNQWIWPPTQ
ncbi:NADH dehydrogenase [Nesidiocoris tenuis]|uniref:NADH dehydrogenase n=1 Tax=Nesidiocoris tenuis TaxID=355587 RepID=A0ABN7AYJ1_9HEMI|nr:NADH dehydrogenase [Nesidiocoris tenuis]